MEIYDNPNKEEFTDIIKAIRINDGYCPCSSEKSEDTKCPCRAFRESDEAEFCNCGLFYKLPSLETLALIGNVTYGGEHFEQWENVLSKQDFIILPVKFDNQNPYHHTDRYRDLCRTKIAHSDAVFILDDETDWTLDIETWSMAIGKRVLHRSDLK